MFTREAKNTATYSYFIDFLKNTKISILFCVSTFEKELELANTFEEELSERNFMKLGGQITRD